ncbi:hypothetical protein [Halotia branconii]|uniref:Uncharacterized protein n=1 Tax=Halotia branconii CENA392 TaxID=1539056 RepID=A0AAJ6NVI8_9CYAN|nr:hypothetical protein [Halotia branconii]WGV27514.1 hypothetical protein QI031_08510 [Halotia branconii CENA392]
MNNHKIELTGIPEPLLKLIDERVRQKGGDRAAYIRDLIERDIALEKQKQPKASMSKVKLPFDLEVWEADMKALAERAKEIPILPPEAFTRKSIYGNHN